MKFYLTATIALILIGCTVKTEMDTEVQKLLALNADQRTAHLTNNAALLVAQLDDSLYVVQDGGVLHNSKAQVLEQFENYFAGVKYRLWDDTTNPIVKISDDATQALVIMQKKIEAARMTADSVGEYSSTQWAWSIAYRKVKGEWKMYLISSGQKNR